MTTVAATVGSGRGAHTTKGTVIGIQTARHMQDRGMMQERSMGGGMVAAENSIGSRPGDGVGPAFSEPDTPTKGSLQRALTLASFKSKTSLYKMESGRRPSASKIVSIEQSHMKSVKASKYLIDPRTSVTIAPWDGITAVALIFTAIVTPLEVSFLRAPSEVDLLFVINRVIDLIFFGDMIVQLFLMYKEPADIVSGHTGRWVSSHRKIVVHYLMGWFSIDFFSLVVSCFDIISIASSSGETRDGQPSAISKFTAFRIIRILRLVKLMRLARASRLYSRWEARVAINYGTLALLKAMFGVILVGHWFACIWSLQTEIAIAMGDESALRESWKFQEHFCSDAENSTYRQLSELDDDDGVECCSAGRLYMASLYWSMMTITSIGYGDITPWTTYEYVVCVFLMLAGGATWGTVIATFCGVLASRDAGLAEFRQTMDDLNTFVRVQGFPQELSVRLREYFNQTKHLQMASSHRALLRMMSPSLQGEVALRCNERWLRRVWFLDGAEPEFMVQVALNLSAMVFAPGELAAANYLYIVHRGMALYGGRVLTAGRVWGEDMILQSTHLQTRYCARAMNYLEVYMIGREELLELATHFPESWLSIRRHATRLALRREFVLQAKQRVEAMAHGVDPSNLSIEKMLSGASSAGSTPSAAPIPPTAAHSGARVSCVSSNADEAPKQRRRTGPLGQRGRRAESLETANWMGGEASLGSGPRALKKSVTLGSFAPSLGASSSASLNASGGTRHDSAPSAIAHAEQPSSSSSSSPPPPEDTLTSVVEATTATKAPVERDRACSSSGRSSVGGGSPRPSDLVGQMSDARASGPAGRRGSMPCIGRTDSSFAAQSMQQIRAAAVASAAFVGARSQELKSPAGKAAGEMAKVLAKANQATAPSGAPSPGTSQLASIQAVQIQHAEAMAKQTEAMSTLVAEMGELRSLMKTLVKGAGENGERRERTAEKPKSGE